MNRYNDMNIKKKFESGIIDNVDYMNDEDKNAILFNEELPVSHIINKKPRFIPEELLCEMFFCYKLTSVGHSVDYNAVPSKVNPFSRYGRILRATAIFKQRNPEIKISAYKDLDTLIGDDCGNYFS